MGGNFRGGANFFMLTGCILTQATRDYKSNGLHLILHCYLPFLEKYLKKNNK